MNRIFVEQVKDGLYCIAAIDTHRIFNAKDPGNLATIFECSQENPTREDDAQVFYAMAPSINGLDIFADCSEQQRSCKLNTWSIIIKDNDIANLFMAVKILERQDRLDLYAKKHSITPSQTIASTSKSLFSLVEFSKFQNWKTGILQECIDRLVFTQFRKNKQVYAVIDEEYRRLMRFKYETELKGPLNIKNDTLISSIHRIMSSLGLKNTRDTTIFPIIPDIIDHYLNIVIERLTAHKIEGSLRQKLSQIIFIWSGSNLIESEGGFKLELNPTVSEGLSYMQPLLYCPEMLTILETPM